MKEKKYSLDEIFSLFGNGEYISVSMGYSGFDIRKNDCKIFLSRGHTPKEIYNLHIDKIYDGHIWHFNEKQKNEYYTERKKEFLELQSFCRENKYNLKYFTDYENLEQIMEDIYITKDIYRKKKKKTKGHIYIYKDGELYKIGKTIDVSKRNKSYITENPRATMIHSYCCDDYTKEETRLHNMFSEKRKTGEWFELSDEDVSYLINL